MNIDARKYRTVLFDFDGTLVNTTPLILRCFRATWQKMFGFELADAAYIQTFGIPLDTAMALMLRQMADEKQITALADHDSVAEEMVTTYRAFNHEWHDQMIQPFAGVDETLRELKRRGCRLGVVTSKKRVGAERGMRIFRMIDYFEVSVCAEDTQNNKPHPEPLLCAMKSLSAGPHETIYLGDSTHDIVAGRAANVATAAAAWGPFGRSELEILQPDYLLDEPAGLLAYCGEEGAC
ncbi:MAG TPA: HAD-IA family hydrolase [Blastocatellia bacterium]|nr:HAD-IA family hydrolase [Blastocatellia bacterium]